MKRFFIAAAVLLSGKTPWPRIEIAGKLDPEFDIQSRIAAAVRNLPPAIAVILQKHDLKFVAAHDFGRFKDKNPTRFADIPIRHLPALNAARSMFSGEDMIIFLPQFRRTAMTVSTKDEDTQHLIFNECGHALNEIARHASKKRVSDTPDFIRAFNTDMGTLVLSDEALIEKLERFIDLQAQTPEGASDNRCEILGELFAEALDEWVAERTGAKAPNTFKLSQHFPETARFAAQFLKCPGLFVYGPSNVVTMNTSLQDGLS